MPNKIVYRHFDHPTDGFARRANGVGLEAWTKKLGSRLAVPMDAPFDTNPDRLQMLMHRAQKIGSFSGVAAQVETSNGMRTVGAAWGFNNTPGKWPARKLANFLGYVPRAHIAQVDVLPEFQKQGIGTDLIGELMSDFHPDQIATTVINRNESSTERWLVRDLGFHAISSDYVSDASLLLEAQSVSSVQERVSRIDSIRIQQSA